MTHSVSQCCEMESRSINLLEFFFREAYSGAGYKVYNYAVSDNELLGTKDYNFLFVLKSILFPIFSFFVLKIL